MIEDGETFLLVMAALANPHRLRILAHLQGDTRPHVSELARQVGLSRPLLLLHLRKLEEAGLVGKSYEVAEDGKSRSYFEPLDFRLEITATAIAGWAATLALPPTDHEDPS